MRCAWFAKRVGGVADKYINGIANYSSVRISSSSVINQSVRQLISRSINVSISLNNQASANGAAVGRGADRRSNTATSITRLVRITILRNKHDIFSGIRAAGRN